MNQVVLEFLKGQSTLCKLPHKVMLGVRQPRLLNVLPIKHVVDEVPAVSSVGKSSKFTWLYLRRERKMIRGMKMIDRAAPLTKIFACSYTGFDVEICGCNSLCHFHTAGQI